MTYRPETFADFHGQAKVKENLRIATASAVMRKAPVPHLLLAGPAGLGKTTLAGVVAKERGVDMTVIAAPALEKPKDLVGPLTSLKTNGILFLDEIHGIDKTIEEFLYSAMEDGKIQVYTDEDHKDFLTLNLDPFTLIGATTREGLLSKPLRDRFKLTERLKLYGDTEMAGVVDWTITQFITKEGMTFESQAEISKSLVSFCHGTARHVQRFLEAIRDTAMAKGDGKYVTCSAVTATMERLGYSMTTGLSAREADYLRVLGSAQFPKGVNAIAELLDDEETTVEETIEPWLVQIGAVERTPRGRSLTTKGRELVDKLRQEE